MDRAPNGETTDSESVSGSSGDRSAGASAWRKALRDVAPYLDLGWRLAGTAAFPPLIGYAVDVWLQTLPWFLLAGCVFGFSGAILQLVRLQDDARP